MYYCDYLQANGNRMKTILHLLTFGLLLIFLLLFSCTNKQENKSGIETTTQNSHTPLHTVIAGLPDSLKPKTYALAAMPQPQIVVIPKNGGVTKMLPVLQNEKGEPILSSEGKHFIMGDAGKSNFYNFTHNNGLALDTISVLV